MIGGLDMRGNQLDSRIFGQSLATMRLFVIVLLSIQPVSSVLASASAQNKGRGVWSFLASPLGLRYHKTDSYVTSQRHRPCQVVLMTKVCHMQRFIP